MDVKILIAFCLIITILDSTCWSTSGSSTGNVSRTNSTICTKKPKENRMRLLITLGLILLSGLVLAAIACIVCRNPKFTKYLISDRSKRINMEQSNKKQTENPNPKQLDQATMSKDDIRRLPSKSLVLKSNNSSKTLESYHDKKFLKESAKHLESAKPLEFSRRDLSEVETINSLLDVDNKSIDEIPQLKFKIIKSLKSKDSQKIDKKDSGITVAGKSALVGKANQRFDGNNSLLKLPTAKTMSSVKEMKLSAATKSASRATIAMQGKSPKVGEKSSQKIQTRTASTLSLSASTFSNESSVID